MVDPKIITHPHGDRTFTSTLYYGADVRESLRLLEPQSVQCVVTSPPYWGLRSYLPEGSELKDREMGGEGTLKEYIANMVAVFREVRRVLRDNGVIWVNLGDSYCGGGGFAPSAPSNVDRRERLADGVPRSGSFTVVKSQHIRNNNSSGVKPQGPLKSKDLCGIPWRVAFALQDDGWYLRSDVIWSKGKCMPEAVTDRPTRSHEYVFLLTKSSRYFYDADAVREGAVQADRVRADKIGGNKGDETHHSPGSIFEGSTTRNRRSVWTINSRPYKGAHFATMPPALAEVCVKAGTRPGDTVMDPFSGSGTTGYVANRLGRHYVGTDLNADYLPLAEARLTGMDPPETDEGTATEEGGPSSILDML